MTADSGTLSTSSRGGGADRGRYLAGVALSFGGQARQQVQTFPPSTSAASGAPIDPSNALVTGQTFCSSTVRFNSLAVDKVPGTVLVLGVVCPGSWRFSARTVPDAAFSARRAWNRDVSATGVWSVTVAYMPGRS